MKKGEATRTRLKEKAKKLAAERTQEQKKQYALQMAEATHLAGEIPKAYAEANQYMEGEAYQQAVERFLHCKKCLSALKRLTMISATININSGEIDVLLAQCYLKMEQPDNCVISAKMACLQGHSVEMEKLGVWYSRAKQFPPAFEILWAAYMQNKTLRDRDSYDCLGWLILGGFLKKEFKRKQYPLAIEILSVAENQGSLYAAYALGRLYYECEIEKYRDLKKARKCFEKAAQDGSKPESHLQLGLLLTDLQDYQPALLHYRKAIEAGLKGCYRNMGIIYDLILDDKALAIEYYQKAVDESDDPYAMHNLGLMNQDGEGMPKNPQAALDLYVRAINCGFLDSCPNAANLMMMSNTGVEKNPVKAEEYLRLAAKAKNPLALHCLAIYIREGKFPSQSPEEETLALLLEAAKLGKVESMYSYSILKGVVSVGFDLDVANWYKVAADLGYSLAQFNYALYLAQKKLVTMNDGDPEESAVISLVLEYLEKTGESKDVSLANTALIKLKTIKAFGNTKSVIVEQMSQNKPSEISTIEQEIASIKAARRRPQVKRIGRILQFFNNTSSLSTQNIATALYSIAEIFDENSSVRRPFDEHSADIARLVNFVTDHAEEFKVNELANVFIGLSKLHMHPDNLVMAHCLRAILPILQAHIDVVMLFDGRTVCYAATRFLLNSHHEDAALFCKTLYDRILNQDFTARMGLKLSTESAYFVYIFHQCSNVQLPGTRGSLINLCEQASRFLESTSEKRIIHQWLMINRFFEQQFNEPLEFIKATLKGSEGALLADAQSSRFEDEVADCLRRIDIRFERQRVFNGIPVDFYFPDYDRILEANGPSHYLYGIGEPVLTPRDIARNKFVAKPISLLSYLEWAHWKDLSICDDQLFLKISTEYHDFPQRSMTL